MINPLNHDEKLTLSVDDLAHRVDSIFFASAVERYGNDFIEKSLYFSPFCCDLFGLWSFI
jgi:hypothetical protein